MLSNDGNSIAGLWYKSIETLLRSSACSHKNGCQGETYDAFGVTLHDDAFTNSFCKIYELEELDSYDGKYRQTFFQSLVLFSFNRQFDAFQLCLIQLVEEV